jgi:hypothetical protein
MDSPAIDLNNFNIKNLFDKNYKDLALSLKELGIKNLPEFFELMTTPSSKLLSRWFESEPLKSTLAIDSIIGK